MAKIHTHYDNLKVARLAPQEVIRAAYKALSQKYHPDKNPGDEKAARIMAILNSAYSILSDPVRRKEHDEWIAAEEWEIEWLESTRAEEGRGRQRAEAAAHAWEAAAPDAPAPRGARAPSWWFALGACFLAGCAAGLFFTAQPGVLPAALAAALGTRAEAFVPAGQPLAQAASADSWAVGQPYFPEVAGQQGPEVKALAVTELQVPARQPDCDSELHSLVAPNGESWPASSGYVDGYQVSNRGDEMKLMLDNSANASPVFVKVFDLDRRSNVRHVFVQARDSISIDKLAAGKYEVRYQNIEVGGTRAECVGRRKGALKQAAAN